MLTPTGMPPRRSSPSTGDALREALAAGANSAGGWGYYASKSSRIEPSTWARAALGPAGPSAAAASFLTAIQRPDGWLVEDPSWPVNIGFNATAAFLAMAAATPASVANDAGLRRLLAALAASKGVTAAQDNVAAQNDSLQGWSWVDGTFSWVEPTVWGVLALKKALRLGIAPAGADARIDEGDRLLVDRCCRAGGWNFGNAVVFGTDLRPYVPTTALALLALQDRADDPAVVRSLAFLESHWQNEVSALAIGLSIICLDVYGRPVADLESRLADHADAARTFGNFHGMAVALLALTPTERTRVFRL